MSCNISAISQVITLINRLLQLCVLWLARVTDWKLVPRFNAASATCLAAHDAGPAALQNLMKSMEGKM